MTRAASTSVENNFTKGLITEASGMNFPENAAQDTMDCVFTFGGEVTRREGFQPEANGVFQTVTSDTNAVSEFLWQNVANLGNLTFVVQQVGMVLYFFEVSGTALSPGLKSSHVNLSSFLVSGGSTVSDGSVCNYASGNGKLFVTYPHCNPFYVTYDLASDTLTGTAIALRVRDFRRLVDNLQPDERPPTLTSEHKYNLYNQGWYFTGGSQTTSSGGGTGIFNQGLLGGLLGTGNPVGGLLTLGLVNPSSGTGGNSGTSGNTMLDYWHAHRSDYPSNADIWWLFKNADDVIDADNFNKVFNGNTLTVGGHYIMDPFNTTRQDQAGIAGIAEDTAGSARPTTCAFYSGRVFYGGVQADGYGDKIYFSQILENDAQIGYCYQNQDPTSENNSDLLPSDGGVIQVQGLGTLQRLYHLQGLLLVFGSNGVWSISGGSGQSFYASDYSVQKVSEHPCVGSMNLVQAEGGVVWWNYYGLMLLTSDQTGAATVASISNSTIKSFFETIPQNNIAYVKGAYNPFDHIVQWLYRSTEATTLAQNFQYDRVLNLRSDTQAFYPWTIGTTAQVLGAPFVSGIVATQGTGVTRADVTVSSNGNTVILA